MEITSVSSVSWPKYFPLDCSSVAFISLLIGVSSQIGASFLLTFFLIIQSILWCREVRDRVLIITCSPIVSFDCFPNVLYMRTNFARCKFCEFCKWVQVCEHLTGSGVFFQSKDTIYTHLADCYNGIQHTQFAKPLGKVVYRALREKWTHENSHSQGTRKIYIPQKFVCIQYALLV